MQDVVVWQWNVAGPADRRARDCQLKRASPSTNQQRCVLLFPFHSSGDGVICCILATTKTDTTTGTQRAYSYVARAVCVMRRFSATSGHQVYDASTLLLTRPPKSSSSPHRSNKLHPQRLNTTMSPNSTTEYLFYLDYNAGTGLTAATDLKQECGDDGGMVVVPYFQLRPTASTLTTPKAASRC
jgi:hypothetical protein